MNWKEESSQRGFKVKWHILNVHLFSLFLSHSAFLLNHSNIVSVQYLEVKDCMCKTNKTCKTLLGSIHYVVHKQP